MSSNSIDVHLSRLQGSGGALGRPKGFVRRVHLNGSCSVPDGVRSKGRQDHPPLNMPTGFVRPAGSPNGPLRLEEADRVVAAVNFAECLVIGAFESHRRCGVDAVSKRCLGLQLSKPGRP